MVEYFVKPLVKQHQDLNMPLIENINAEILSEKSCNSCYLSINSAASNPKDQSLHCNRCNKVFHKKCTDRIKSKANWRRQPWFCQHCILDSDVNNVLNERANSDVFNLNPSAVDFQPAGSTNAPSSSLSQPAGRLSSVNYGTSNPSSNQPTGRLPSANQETSDQNSNQPGGTLSPAIQETSENFNQPAGRSPKVLAQ